MSNDTSDRAAREATLFFGAEITPEALETLLEIRFPDLTDEDRKILVEQALTE